MPVPRICNTHHCSSSSSPPPPPSWFLRQGPCLCSSGYLGTNYVNQDGFQLTDLSGSASQGLELMACAIIPNLTLLL